MQDKARNAGVSARNLLQDSAVMMLEAESMTPNKASLKGTHKNQKPMPQDYKRNNDCPNGRSSCKARDD
jgi:hypothetical protein